MTWPRTRTQILIVLILLGAMPVFAWFAAREIEQFLRDAEERALVAVARSLVQALRAGDAVPGDRRQRLYVQGVELPLVVDGIDDDWGLWQGQETDFSSSTDALRARLLLATDGRRLFGMVSVTDTTSGSRRSITAQGTDHVLLRLSDGLDYRIEPGAAPGAAEVMVAGSSMSAPNHIVQAAWRDRGASGYVVEFKVPVSLALPSLGIVVRDFGATGVQIFSTGTTRGDALTPWPLLLRSERWSERLAQALAPGQRAWLVDLAGHPVAVGGTLAAEGEILAGWRAIMYRLLSADALTVGGRRDPRALLRLRAPEVGSALHGEAAVAWRIAEDGAVIASTAVPLYQHGRVAGALLLEAPAEGLLIVTNRVLARTVLTAIGALFVVGLALGVIASIQSYRVRRLSRAIATGDEGALGRDLPESKARDELGDLARGFASLIGELESYNAYLQQLAARLAHELGTPLAVVRSSLDNIATFSLDSEMAPYVRRAQDGADRLRAILRAMSEARRLEQAISVAEMETIDLGEMVEMMVGGYRAVDPEHRWSVRSDEEIKVKGAGELLAQALDKLADNARGFTPPEGEIKVEVYRKGRYAIMAVTNEGPALPRHMQRRIFESMISIREPSGQMHLGLGLHIVRLVARAHGGDVRAQNLDDGSGVRFEVRLRASV